MPGSICLGPFLRGYRADGRGHGHPAYDPKALLGVLRYGYAIGVRSSRQIERRCHLRTSPSGCLAGNQIPTPTAASCTLERTGPRIWSIESTSSRPKGLY
jgi:hypothetical protein